MSAFFVTAGLGGSGFIGAFVAGIAFSVGSNRHAQEAIAFTENQRLKQRVNRLCSGGRALAEPVDSAIMLGREFTVSQHGFMNAPPALEEPGEEGGEDGACGGDPDVGPADSIAGVKLS